MHHFHAVSALPIFNSHLVHLDSVSMYPKIPPPLHTTLNFERKVERGRLLKYYDDWHSSTCSQEKEDSKWHPGSKKYTPCKVTNGRSELASLSFQVWYTLSATTLCFPWPHYNCAPQIQSASGACMLRLFLLMSTKDWRLEHLESKINTA